MTLNNNYFLLFQNCIAVKGNNGSIIMDLDASSYLDIPDLLFDIIITTKGLKINQVKEYYNHKYDEGIDGYFNYLVDNKYGFYSNDISCFISAPIEFHSPYKVISSIVALNDFNIYNINDTINQLAELSCQLLQIRIYNEVEFNELQENLISIIEAPFRIVELFLRYTEKISIKELQDLCVKHPNLIIIIHGSPEKKQIEINSTSHRKLSYYKTLIINDTKELFNKSTLNISQPLYYEALNYNAGLYRKVCIDEYGNIKNYLSHETVYGNINTVSIVDTIQKNEFQKKSNISNDHIEVCKDCKYRYMCINNSDIEEKDGKFYKTKSCNLL